MKEIINQYGSMTIAMIVLFFIFAVVINGNYNGGHGLVMASGNLIKTSSDVHMNSSTSSDSYIQYKTVKTPELKLDRTYQIYEGESIKVSDFLTINNGVSGDYKIYRICRSDGEIICSDLLGVNDNVTFSEAGIDQLYLKVYSSNGRKSYSKLRIPVNRR